MSELPPPSQVLRGPGANQDSPSQVVNMDKTVILMRHAKSSWDNANQTDHERELNAQGREATPQMASWLAEMGWIPELIIASNSRRTMETAELLLAQWSRQIELEPIPSLYHAPASTYFQVASRAPERYSSIMLLGHNPGISILAGQISPEIDQMPTAAVAVIQIPVALWSEISTFPLSRMKLVAFQTPKSLAED